MSTATAKPRAGAKRGAPEPTELADRAARRARQLEKRNANYERVKASLIAKLNRRARSSSERDQDECTHIENDIIRVEHEQFHAQDHLIEMVPPGFFDGKRDLSRRFTMIAKNIEDSMVKAGAEAGVDYTYLDLYKLAAPFRPGDVQRHGRRQDGILRGQLLNRGRAMTDENANTADLTMDEKLERLIREMATMRTVLIDWANRTDARLDKIEQQLQVLAQDMVRIRADQQGLNERLDALERRPN